MFRALFIAVLALSFSAAVPAGVVHTRDGKKPEGALTLAEGKIVVKPKTGPEISVPLDNLASAAFDPPPNPQPTTRKSGWQPHDIGEIHTTGGQFTVAADRFDLNDRSRGLRTKKKGFDNFFFVCQEIRGDCTLIARLRVVEGRYARAGLMIRSSLNPDAPFAMTARSSEETTSLLRRSAPGADPEPAGTTQQRIMGAAWLKLERTGYTFTASESVDGQKWTTVGAAEIPMDEEVLAGLASTASGTIGGASCRSLFDKVQLVAGETKSAAERTPRGVLLKSGTSLAATIESADESVLNIAIGQEKRPLALANVAQCFFVALLPAHEEKLKTSGVGVLLINGDFLDGEFKGIDQNQVKITSVLFGAKNIDTRHQAAALNLRKPELHPAQFEIRLADRSIIRAKSLKLFPNQIVLEEPILGELKLPPQQLAQIRRCPTPN